MISLVKRDGWLTRFVSISIAFLFIWTFLVSPDVIAQQQVQVPVGTAVTVKTTTTLTPEQYNIGDTVELSVVSDVIVEVKVVVKAGAVAKGEIIAAKTRNLIGIPAKIGVSLRSVQAVDGTTVLLSGSKVIEGKDNMVASIGLALVCCILFALMKGGEASIPEGTQIDGTVAGTIKIEVM